MSAPQFDDLSDILEAMIDWPRRLANEQGFYRWLFDRVKATSVLDAACGTGHHAALFHTWGMQVEGADLSPRMIERARAQAGQWPTLRWMVRGFDQPTDTPGMFDAAICVGNSLALAGSRETARKAIGQLLSAVHADGAVLVHVVNLWSMPEGIPKWQKCRRAPLPGGEGIILKGIHRAGSNGYVNLLVVDSDRPQPDLRSECICFLGLDAAELAEWAKRGGAKTVEFYGDYQRQPYDRDRSQDLIMLAIKE